MTSYGSMSSLSSTHSANSNGGAATTAGGASGTQAPPPDYPETIINIKQMKEVMEQGIMM